MKRGGSLIAGMLALALVVAPGAEAKTFEVTRTADSAPNGCNQAGCTLREAVIAANGRPGSDTIELRSAKTYEMQIAGPGEDAAATGDLDLTGPTAVRTTARRQATVDAAGLDRAFDTEARASFLGIRVVGGMTQAVMGEEEGGAIRARGGRLLLRRCAFGSIVAPPLGLGAANAAIQKLSGGGDIVVERTKVRGTDGVAVLNRGNGDVVLRRSRLTDNFFGGATDFGPGAILASRSVISGGERSGLTDFGGGGVRVVGSRLTGIAQSAITDFDVGRILVERSRVAGSGQDAITDFDAGGVRITRAQVVNNGGDGITDFGGGGIRVAHSAISGNDSTAVGDFDAGGVVVSQSRVTGNGSQGVSDFGGGGVTVSRSRVSGNDSQGVQDFDAGAVSVFRSSVLSSGSQGVQNFGSGTLALRRARVAGSVFEAVAQFGEGSLRITESTVSGAQRSGVEVSDAAAPSRVIASTITGNETNTDGGGIDNEGPLVIRNSTIAGNRADVSGGGIASSGPDADLRLNNVTVARNIADADNDLVGSGGGLFTDNLGPFEVGNSLIGLNDQLGGDGDDCAGGFDSSGGNLRGDATNCTGFDGPGDRVRTSLKIGPLRGNGGPTKTIALKKGSPAIGKARKATAEPRDQRGRKRDRRPDIGAFER